MRYASIRTMDVSNGENIGIALFVQGCHSPHCFNCFNPETWNFSGGKEWTKDVKENFLKLANRPYIKRISILGGEALAEENLDDVLELVTEINKKYNAQLYIDEYSTNKHNRLSCNTDEIRLSSPKKSIWIYTGYKVVGIHDGFWGLEPNVITDKILDPDKLVKGIHDAKRRSDIISKCDVLIDGRYIESKKDLTLKWRGSSNQRVIDVKKSIQQGDIVLWCN